MSKPKLGSKTFSDSVCQSKRGLMNEQMFNDIRPGAAPYLRVIAASVVQQGETDVVQPLDFTGVVETLKHPTANIPWTHQTTLDLSWGRQIQSIGWSQGSTGCCLVYCMGPCWSRFAQHAWLRGHSELHLTSAYGQQCFPMKWGLITHVTVLVFSQYVSTRTSLLKRRECAWAGANRRSCALNYSHLQSRRAKRGARSAARSGTTHDRT